MTVYEHQPVAPCGCNYQTVRREVIEPQFLQLLQHLEIVEQPNANFTALLTQPTSTQRIQAIQECKHLIRLTLHLYAEGRIDRQEYTRRMERYERDLAAWEASSLGKDVEIAAVATCILALEGIKREWETASNVAKQDLARSLFEHLVYDLDRQCFVGYALKGWAQPYLHVSLERLAAVAPERSQEQNKRRDAEIRARHAKGEGLSKLAREYGVSANRIYQIVNFKNK
jgi:hypothetical protein